VLRRRLSVSSCFCALLASSSWDELYLPWNSATRPFDCVQSSLRLALSFATTSATLRLSRRSLSSLASWEFLTRIVSSSRPTRRFAAVSLSVTPANFSLAVFASASASACFACASAASAPSCFTCCLSPTSLTLESSDCCRLDKSSPVQLWRRSWRSLAVSASRRMSLDMTFIFMSALKRAVLCRRTSPSRALTRACGSLQDREFTSPVSVSQRSPRKAIRIS